MTDINKEFFKKDDLALIEDLERRFGPAMAQEIMDELKKAEKPKKVASGINYMGAKTLSEAAENPTFEFFSKIMKSFKISLHKDAPAGRTIRGQNSTVSFDTLS